MFRRNCNDWELGRTCILLQQIGIHSTNADKKDIFCWKGRKDGIFSVKSCYTLLLDSQNATSVWLWEKVWRSSAPYKVQIFTWLVGENACLTQPNLQQMLFMKRATRGQTTYFCIAKLLLNLCTSFFTFGTKIYNTKGCTQTFSKLAQEGTEGHAFKNLEGKPSNNLVGHHEREKLQNYRKCS